VANQKSHKLLLNQNSCDSDKNIMAKVIEPWQCHIADVRDKNMAGLITHGKIDINRLGSYHFKFDLAYSCAEGMAKSFVKDESQKFFHGKVLTPMHEYINVLENALIYAVNTSQTTTKIEKPVTIMVPDSKNVSMDTVKKIASGLLKWNSSDWFPFRVGMEDHYWDGCVMDAKSKTLHFPLVVHNQSPDEQMMIVGEVIYQRREKQKTLFNTAEKYLCKECDYMEEAPKGTTMPDFKISNLEYFIDGLLCGTIDDIGDRSYMAFKEALAACVMPYFRTQNNLLLRTVECTSIKKTFGDKGQPLVHCNKIIGDSIKPTANKKFPVVGKRKPTSRTSREK